jgi:membrane protein CcdC involved in cytochrome C biogenesis
MNWTKWNIWARQFHRWMAVVFTVAVIVNFVVLAFREPPFWVYLLPLPPLFLLMFTGWYMFVLPYAAKWRGARRANT